MLNNFGILAHVSYASCTVLELGASKTALSRKIHAAVSVINALHTCKHTHAIHIQPFVYMRPGSKDRSTQCCRMAGNCGMLPDSYACYVSRSPPFHKDAHHLPPAVADCLQTCRRQLCTFCRTTLCTIDCPGQRHELNIALYHGRTSKYCHK